jgi:hypothetical protein
VLLGLLRHHGETLQMNRINGCYKADAAPIMSHISFKTVFLATVAFFSFGGVSLSEDAQGNSIQLHCVFPAVQWFNPNTGREIISGNEFVIDTSTVDKTDDYFRFSRYGGSSIYEVSRYTGKASETFFAKIPEWTQTREGVCEKVERKF